MCEVLTDNRNRTAPEIRKIFEMANGKLGAAGCVAWMFDKKGLFIVSADRTDEDTLMEICLEAGAEDVRRDGDKFEITCSPDAYGAVAGALRNAGIEPEVSEISLLANNTVELDADTARKVLKLMENLDDHDDVQSVSSNFNIPEEVMAAISQE
jgi:YebC/PmpR family DNA-binding regulatory protein